MAWYDSVGKVAKGVLDFTGIPGLIHDVSTAGSNQDPWYVDGLNMVKDIGQIASTPIRGAVKGLLAAGQASYELGGKARQYIDKGILDTPLMYNKFKNEDETYDQYRQRVAANVNKISLGETALSLLSPGKNADQGNGWFQDWTENNAKFLSAGFDLFNPDDRKVAFQNQYTGKFLSGMQDAVASTVIDPLTFTGFLGKGAVIAAKAPMLENINGRLARAVFGKFAATPESMDNLLTKAVDGQGRAAKTVDFLANTDAKGQYNYWAKQKVTNPDAMAYLFGKTQTSQEVVDTFRAVMLKDTQAMATMAEKDPVNALILDNFNDVPNPARQVLNGKLEGDLLTDPNYSNAISSYVTELANTDDRYRAALGKVMTGTELRQGFGMGFVQNMAINKAQKAAEATFGKSQFIEPDIQLFQPTSLHPIVKVVNYFKQERPSGVFNVNDADSYKEFNAFLTEANQLSKGTFSDKAAAYADEYLNSMSPGERLNTIARAEKDSLAHLFPNYSQEMLDKVYAIYDSRRAKAIARMKDQGFVSYMDGDQVVHAVSPVLQSESANNVVIADLRKLKYGMDAHERVLPNLLSGVDAEDIALRSQRALHALDTVNDIFKTSVLLRLGYTVRNLAEAQMSILAKGMAMPSLAAAGAKDSLERFFNNRQVGFNRLADSVNVMLGRTDDLRTMQGEFARETDRLRSIDMSRKNLSNAISNRLREFEQGRFTPRFTEGEEPGVGVGPLTMEDEYRTLKGAHADLESKTLYHGSPESSFSLDMSKPLSASASPDRARKYAQQDYAVGLENYLNPSGRPTPIRGVTGEDIAVRGERGVPAPGVNPRGREVIDPITAAENMKQDMIAATRSGNTVLVRRLDNKTFHQVSEDSIRNMDPATLKRAVFRVQRNDGSVTPVRVYGSELDMTKYSGLPTEVKDMFTNADGFNQWVKDKGYKNPQDPIYRYLRDEGYGHAKVVDDARAGGVSHIVLPEKIGEVGRKSEVDSYIQNLMAQKMPPRPELPVEPMLNTAKERRDARRVAIRQDRAGYRDQAVSPYYASDNVHAMINNGVEDAAARLSQLYAESHQHLDDMAARIGARVTAAENNAIKQRLGYGTMNITAGGHDYELPKAFEGATWFMGRSSSEDTWNSMVNNHEMAFLTGVGSRSVRTMQPNDPRYFEGWANILNMHFRDPESGVMDPVVRKILDGADDQQIVNWMKNTREGRYYANDTYTRVGQGFGPTKLRGGELDEELASKVAQTRGSVQLYIPDNDTALMLSAAKENNRPLTGGDVQQYLVDRFGGQPEKLPAINGLLVTTAKEYKDQERIIDSINRRVMRFLGSLPEDVFARHPLTSALYERQLKLSIAKMAAAKGSESLTADEINRAVTASREFARQETERTLFTIVRRTGASGSQAMKLLFPFYAAYENTIQRWSGIAAENPSVVTTAARDIAQIVNGQMVVDSNGNRVTDAKQLSGAQGGNLVVRVPQGFIDSLPGNWKAVANDAFKKIQIPLSSLDVITQGQPGNPGFGPFAVLPAYLIVKDRPELQDAFKSFFPAGLPQSPLDSFTPSVVRRLKTNWSQDGLYVRTFNQMLRYESYNYNQGLRTTQPTVDEIKDKTNKFFLLRALSSIALPVAVSPEADFYQQQYRQFQQMYTKPGEADAKFLQMYPDFFEATVSLSKNIGGLEPSIQTVRNVRKFGGLMAQAEGAGDPELMGFIADDGDGKYTFSQAAYQWESTHGAYPGSVNTFRQNRNPAELVKDANVKMGWTQFGKLQDYIDAYKIQNGIISNRDPRLKQLNSVKSDFVNAMESQNKDWYEAYLSPDKAKYMRRADVLQSVLQDKKWMAQNGDRAVVKSLVVYLEGRNSIQNLLNQRKAAGGSSNIDANTNADIAYVWDQLRTTLAAGSPEFGKFQTRYFTNDKVTV